VLARTPQETQYIKEVMEAATPVLQHIVRGVEAWALWHHVQLKDVAIHKAYWSCDDKLVIEFDRVVEETPLTDEEAQAIIRGQQ
jgi:hypothetical protein